MVQWPLLTRPHSPVREREEKPAAFRRSFPAAAILCVLFCLPGENACAQKGENQVNDETVSRLAVVARNPEQELSARIAALRELAAMQSANMVPDLLAVWKRPKVNPQIRPIDWDPIGVERVVDAYTILALYRHGNSTLLPEIAGLVKQAGTVLTGPDSELNNAAAVIRAIQSLQPVGDLIQLTNDPQESAVTNAVRTLQLLQLPDAPTGRSIPEVSVLRKPVSFTIHRLSEELRTIAAMSGGWVSLSSGTLEFLRTHDYDRGRVERTDTTLAEILTRDLDMLDLAYAVTPNRVEICTFREAGSRWRQAWPACRNELAKQGWAAH